MDKYLGKRIDGRYEIHQLIGMGGMACVYRAFDNQEQRWVAIKILKDEYSGNTEFLKRFRNESRAIAVLSHPNIVKVYDVSFGDRIQYIVMEYIEGITLKDYISHNGALPWKEAVHFVSQILKALQQAHSKGIHALADGVHAVRMPLFKRRIVALRADIPLLAQLKAVQTDILTLKALDKRKD